MTFFNLFLYAFIGGLSLFHEAASAVFTPLWVSAPWQGTGGWTNYTIQLEVISFSVLPSVDNPNQFYLNYDYVVTDVTGSLRRVSPADYTGQLNSASTTNSTSSNSNATVIIQANTTSLNESSQITLTIYGTYLKQIQQSLIAVAISQAYNSSNPVWSSLSNASVVMGTPYELLGPNGESLTRCRFWLQGVGASTTLTRPSDNDFVKALLSVGIFTTVSTSNITFNVVDGFGLYVNGIVFDRDLPQFQSVLSSTWRSTSRLSAVYGNLSLVVLNQERYYTDNATSITRLSYFIYGGALNDSSSFYVLNKASANISAPAAETVLPYLQASPIGSNYTLLSSGNGTLYAAKYAFSLLSVEEVRDNSTFYTIQTQLQSVVNTAFSSSNFIAKVLISEAAASEQKMAMYYRTFWFIMNNGIVRDSRKENVFQQSSVSINVTLPTGLPLTVINDNTVFDTQLRLSSCFQLFSTSSVRTYTDLQQAITTALSTKYTELTSSLWNVSVVVVANVEYTNYNQSKGSLISSLHFAIKLVYKNFVKYVDASTSPELSLKASDITLNGSALVEASYVAQQNYVPYSSTWSLMLTSKPLQFQVDMLLANVTNKLKQQFSFTVSCLFTRIDEFQTSDGRTTIWKVGFVVLSSSGVVQLPSVPAGNYSSINVMSPRGTNFTAITDPSVIVSLVRVSDLFTFDLNLPVTSTVFDIFNSKLSAAYQSLFRGQWQSIKTWIVRVDEIITCTKCDNTYRIYLSVMSGQWMLSSKKVTTLSTSVVSSLFGSLKTKRGLSYSLAPAAPSNSTLLSQVFEVFSVSRPVLDTDVTVFESTLKSLLQQQLPTGIGNLSISFVQQTQVQICTTASCGNIQPLKDQCAGQLCNYSPWELRFVASLGSDRVYADVLPLNLIQESTFESQLSNSTSTQYSIDLLSGDVTTVDVRSLFKLSFTAMPAQSRLSDFASYVRTIYSTDFSNSTVNVSSSGPFEVINLSSNSSAWQVLFFITINGNALDNLVDAPINVTRFNALSSTQFQAVDVSDNGTVSVDNCLKVYVTGVISQLDWSSLSVALSAAYGGKATVTVLQTVVLTSLSGDSFTEIRSVVNIGGQVINAQTLSEIDVTSLKVSLRANNTFISSVNLTSLVLFSKRVQYSIALTQRIVDVDIASFSSQLATLYQTSAAFNVTPNSVFNVTIVSQQNAFTSSGSSFVLISYVVLVNGSVQFDSSYVNSLGVVTTPTASQFSTAISSVSVTSESSTTTKYSFANVTEALVSYESLIKISFMNVVAKENFVDISSVISQFFTTAGSSGFNISVVSQEDVVDSQGMFYSSVGIAIKKLDGTFVSSIDLPTIDLKAISSQMASIVTQSGAKLVTVDAATIGPLMRYSLGWTSYLDQVVTRSSISSVLSVYNNLQPSSGIKYTFGAQDRVVDQSGKAYYRLTIFAMKGNQMVDTRGSSAGSSNLGSLLAANTTFKITTASVAQQKSFISLRRSQRIFVQQSIANASISSFLTVLGGTWSAGSGNISVGANYFVEEFVGDNSQTVYAFSYFISDSSGAAIDASAVKALNSSVIKTVLSSVTGGNYTSYTGSTTTTVSYSSLFKLYFASSLDVDAASQVLIALTPKWVSSLGATSASDVRLNFVGTKKSFGQFGVLVTELLYQVSFKGSVRTNGQDVAPSFNKSEIMAAVSSITVYESSQSPTRADYSFTLVLDGIPASRSVIQDSLSAAWTSKYSSAIINITGIENRLYFAGSGNVEQTVTFVYYTLSINGMMVSSVDYPAPSSFGSLNVSSVSMSGAFQVQSVQISSQLLSVDYFAKLQAALTQAWKSANSGLTGTFLIQISSSKKQKRIYVEDARNYAVRIYYTVQYNGADFGSVSSVVVPSLASIETSLAVYKFTVCKCRGRSFTRYKFKTSGNATIQSLSTKIQSTLQTVWQRKFLGAKVTIRFVSGSSRTKRDTSSDDTVEAQVDTLPDTDAPDGQLGDDQPSASETDSALNVALAADRASTCPNCTTETCSLFAVVGSSTSLDNNNLQQGIIEAFIRANNKSSSDVNVKSLTTSSLTSGSTCVKFCVISVDELAPPSDDEVTSALTALGITFVPSYGSCSATPATSNQVTSIIVSVSVIGGVAVLLSFAALALYMMNGSSNAGPPQDSADDVAGDELFARPPNKSDRGATRGKLNGKDGRGTVQPSRGYYVSPAANQSGNNVERGVFNQTAPYGTMTRQGQGRGVYMTSMQVGPWPK